MALDEVVNRLAANELVEGILVIGSASRADLTPTSDYDLLVILRRQPVPVRTVITQIDGREAEIFFTTAETLNRIEARGVPVPNDSDDELLIHWLQSGQIVYDPAAYLSHAQQIFRSHNWILLAGETQRYITWFKLNNHLRQVLRLAASDDPVDRLAAQLKLLDALHELFASYFFLRRIPWRGHKLGIKYLAAHDPNYLAHWQELLAEAELERRVTIFVELVRRTLEPVGSVLRDAEVGVQFEPGVAVTRELLSDGERFWEQLLSGAYAAPWMQGDLWEQPPLGG